MRFTSQSDMPPAEYIRNKEDVAEVCRYFEDSPGPIGFDTETSGLDFDGLFVDCFCVGLANNERRVVIPTYNGAHPELWGSGAGNLDPLLPFLKNTQHRHAGYNWIYDVNVLYGYTRWKLRTEPFQLTECWADGLKLFCHFDEEGEDTFGVRALKDRCRHWLGLPMNDFDKVVQGQGFGNALHDNFELSVDYAARDAWGHLGLGLLGQQVTEQLPWCMRCPECNDYCFHQNPSDSRQWRCLDHGWVSGGPMTTMWDWHTELDIPFLHVLQKMQVRGLPVDWGYLAAAVDPINAAIDRAEVEFHAIINAALTEKYGVQTNVSLNMRSDPKLRQLFHGEFDSDGNPVGFGLPVYAYTDSGTPSMKSDTLRALMVRQQAPGVLKILEHRKLQKILSTYVVGLSTRRFPETGRLHGKFRPTTTTGRLRSADPNMQNFPTRTIYVYMPPTAPYIPTAEEIMEGWGYTMEEANRELDEPEYQPRNMGVNIREAVACEEGMSILCADYSQLEIRLTALDSRCPALTKVLNAGLDMHCYAAARAFAAALTDLGEGIIVDPDLPAGYLEIYEAKQADDGDLGPRHAVLRSLVDDLVREDVLKKRVRKVASLAEVDASAQTLSAVADLLATYGGEAADDTARLREEAPELYLAALGVLGLRDKEFLNLRKAAKACIFGIIYGIGPTKLASQIAEATGLPFTLNEAKLLIVSVKDDVFEGIGQMVARQKATLRECGYVRTAMGRYRHPAGVYSGNSGKRAKAERQSTNSPIQGLAADVVQRAMIAVDADEELASYGAVLLSQVHDELLMLVPTRFADKALARLRQIMETAHRLFTPVPLTVTGHHGRDWNEAK